MTKKTRQYSEVLSATTTVQYHTLPSFSRLTIINLGSQDVDINVDNDIADVTRKKITLIPRTPYEIAVGSHILHYQATAGTQTLQLVGTRTEKE